MHAAPSQGAEHLISVPKIVGTSCMRAHSMRNSIPILHDQGHALPLGMAWGVNDPVETIFCLCYRAKIERIKGVIFAMMRYINWHLHTGPGQNFCNTVTQMLTRDPFAAANLLLSCSCWCEGVKLTTPVLLSESADILSYTWKAVAL